MISITPAIKRLKIRNYGMVRKADIKFTKGINIIYGVCGGGKTTVINAISHMTNGEKLIYGPSENKKRSEKSEIQVELLGKKLSKEVEEQESLYEACLRKKILPNGRRIPHGINDPEKLKDIMSTGEKMLLEILEMVMITGKGQAILLDEMFECLDKECREILFELFRKSGLQVITTARREDELVKGANVMRLKFVKRNGHPDVYS